MKTPEIKPRPGISQLAGFDLFDGQSAALYLTWLAREYLGNAERDASAGFAFRIQSCTDASLALDAAIVIIRRECEMATTVVGVQKNAPKLAAIDLLERANSAAKAAIENGRIAASYQQSTTQTEQERARVNKSVSVFKRAAEAGRQETHRALAAVCDLYPDSVPTEEV
jgi:hypothetical protein